MNLWHMCRVDQHLRIHWNISNHWSEIKYKKYNEFFSDNKYVLKVKSFFFPLKRRQVEKICSYVFIIKSGCRVNGVHFYIT